MKHYKPTTPSRRHMSVVSYRNVLTRTEPKKSLTRGFKRGVGRNSAGRIKVGDKVITSEKADIKPGNRLPLKKIPAGTFIYNIEILPGSGAKMIRSAGNFAELLAHDGGYA